MQRIIGLLFFFFALSKAGAQTPEDALRYSWNVQNGTARNQAIGGAMGSLGGDITATFVNPAGLAFYRTGDVVFSSGYSFGKSKSTYLGRQEDTTVKKFAIGASGVVFGGGNSGRRNRNTAVSLTVNQVADFKNNFYYRGQNNQSSYSQVFLEEIKNANLRDPNRVSGDFPFGTSLAFNTFWIDTVGGTSPNYQFKTRAPISSGLLQENTVYSSGGITEFALGVGITLSDKLMLGGTIGIPVLRHERQKQFLEADATNNANNNFDFAVFRQGLSTSGAGINLKGGLIFKPQEYWRLGFAFHSPTLYTLTDRNTAEITTNTEGYQGSLSQRFEEVAGTSSEFRYLHMTPLKLIASASYVLREIQDVTRQRGFLTADVEYIPYGMSAYYTDSENGPADAETTEYLKSLNQAISNTYKGALNVRAGGELKFTTFMVRAGAAYYGNPYQNLHNESGSRFNVNGGLGYRNKGFFIDATYVHSLTKNVDIAYRLQNAPYFNANIRNTSGRVLMTIGFKI